MTDPLEVLFRRERAAIVATLAHRLRDLDVAEDALQDAFTRAAARWPVDGVPDKPGAWLTVVAWRCALDRRRRRAELPLDEAFEHPATGVVDDPPLPVDDDKLALILTCCHPALPADSRIALTLRHVAGLDDGEIAAAFLTSRQAMTKRLVRARRKLRDGGVSFSLPAGDELAPRLASVRDVIAAVFTEGHLASGEHPAVRAELCIEALWLARQLHELTPDDGETTGLLALILLHTGRLRGREDDDGRLLTFADQDTALWDLAALAEARALLSRTGRGTLGAYQLQAAIAAVHTFSALEQRPVPWLHVARLYAILGARSPSPVVEVNRAVAVGRADGPRAGLRVLAAIAEDPRVASYVPFHAARADLLERAGYDAAAREAWAQARDACQNPAQREAIGRRLGTPQAPGA